MPTLQSKFLGGSAGDVKCRARGRARSECDPRGSVGDATCAGSERGALGASLLARLLARCSKKKKRHEHKLSEIRAEFLDLRWTPLPPARTTSESLCSWRAFFLC